VTGAWASPKRRSHQRRSRGDQRPVLRQQRRVEEPLDVIALALGEHDAVHAAPGGVVGDVELAHARPGQVPGQHDDAAGRAAQVLEPVGQPAAVADPAREQLC
jgi:hypothetical protein